jgi:hypothetical protein
MAAFLAKKREIFLVQARAPRPPPPPGEALRLARKTQLGPGTGVSPASGACAVHNAAACSAAWKSMQTRVACADGPGHQADGDGEAGGARAAARRSAGTGAPLIMA